MSQSEPATATLAFVRALEDLGIAYVVGGSLASMVHGEARMTLDIDIVVDLAPGDVARLAARLEAEFFCDAGAVREALERRTHFNVFHRGTMFRVDAFPPGTDEFQAELWARRLRLPIDAGSTSEVWVSDPESIVLQKLRWYRKGGEVSGQQWRDVLGVLKVQSSRLDRGWMAEWAARLGVADLLERACAEAGLDAHDG